MKPQDPPTGEPMDYHHPEPLTAGQSLGCIGLAVGSSAVAFGALFLAAWAIHWLVLKIWPQP